MLFRECSITSSGAIMASGTTFTLIGGQAASAPSLAANALGNSTMRALHTGEYNISFPRLNCDTLRFR